MPVAAAIIVLARHVPESRDLTITGKIDAVGAVAGVVFLFADPPDPEETQ